MITKKNSITRDHILVVDDDEMTLHLIKYCLEEEGFVVEMLNDPRLVFEKVRPECTKMIFLDLMMPYLTGEEVLSRLKARDSIHNIPIVLISSSDNLKKMARKYRVKDYLEKPIDPAKLSKIVLEV